MKRFVSILGFTLALCGASTAQEIGGRYAVEGTNPSGNGGYSGTAEIRGTTGGQCAIVWRLGNAAPVNGFCMRQDDTFVAAYQSGNGVGLAIYHLGPGNVLEGTWSIAGQKGVGGERLTPIR